MFRTYVKIWTEDAFLRGIKMHILIKYSLFVVFFLTSMCISVWSGNTDEAERGSMIQEDADISNPPVPEENNPPQPKVDTRSEDGREQQKIESQQEVQSNPPQVTTAATPVVLDVVSPPKSDGNQVGRDTILVKTCDQKIAVTTDKSVLDVPGNESCLSLPKSVSRIYDKNQLLNGIMPKLTEVTARLDANFKNLDEVDKDLVDVIGDRLETLATGDKTSSKINFYQGLNPEIIRFMFSLCVQSYYDKRFSLNENNVSAEYHKLQNALKSNVARLEGLLAKITKFKDFMNTTFGSDTIIRLKEKRKDKEKMRQQERIQSVVGELGQEHVTDDIKKDEGTKSEKQGNIKETSKEERDIKIQNVAPKLLKAVVDQYNILFKGDPIIFTDTLTLADVEEKIAILQLRTENRLVDARRALEIFSDKRVGEFWAKMEMIFDREADGFKPIDVFYRNIKRTDDPFIGKSFIGSKENEGGVIEGKSGNKEFSGIMMYRPDESDSAKKMDQVIIAFSGSNSAEDWRHNFDGFVKEGKASVNLAAGLRAHNGIMTSLEDSLQEVGTKIKLWCKKYEALHKNDKEIPTLRIYLTGHSLGGALALLTAVYIKQNIVPYMKGIADIDIKVYTFGAPPVFEKNSAIEVEDLLGKTNIIRVWNVGDPVPNLSIVRKNENVFKNSLLMLLLGYRHVGLSVPLYDNKNMADILDVIRPWSNHLADRYNNLIVTNWDDLINYDANMLYRKFPGQDLSRDNKIKHQLQDIIEFVHYPSQLPVLLVSGITPDDLNNLIEAGVPTPLPPEKRTIENYEAVVQDQYKQGITKSPVLGKAEKDRLIYTHQLPGLAVKMDISRSTSCELSNIIKISKIDKKQLKDTMGQELSCGCCLSKNFFLSKDDSWTNWVRGKKIDTIEQVRENCYKHCKTLQSKLFPANLSNVEAIGQFMDRMGLGEMWKNKKFKN